MTTQHAICANITGPVELPQEPYPSEGCTCWTWHDCPVAAGMQVLRLNRLELTQSRLPWAALSAALPRAEAAD